MQQRVDQHRAVSGREHESIAIGPGGIGGIEFHEPREQHRRDVGGAHGQPWMPRFCLLDRVHGERANGVRHAFMLGRVTGLRSGGSPAAVA